MKQQMVIMLFLAVLSITGCGVESPPGRGPDVDETGTTRLSRNEWARRYVEWNDSLKAYVVEGDILLGTEEEVSAHFEQWVQNGALTVNRYNGTNDIWSPSEKRRLTYCVSMSFGADHGAVIATMHQAARAWEQVANVRFIHQPEQDSACTNTNKNVLFNVVPLYSTPVDGKVVLAYAFFPHQSRAKRQLHIDWAYSTHVWPMTAADVLKHELGHILGFRHEHIRVTETHCRESSNWRSVTPYDASSIMHYSHCPGASTYAGLIITQRDADGAATLYGAQTNVVLDRNKIYARKLTTDELWMFDEIPGDWSRVSSPGDSFAVAASRLYRLSPLYNKVYRLESNGTWTHVGGAMGQLYAGRDALYATDSDTGYIWRFNGTPGDWSHVGGPGKTFAVAGSTLYGISPDGSGVYRLEHDGRWIPVGGPAGELYSGQDTLFATNPETGDIWKYTGMPGVWGLVGGPGRTFAVAGSTLYGLAPDGSGIFRLEDNGWWAQIHGPAAWIYGGHGDRLCATTADTEQIECYSNSIRHWTHVGLP